MMIICNLIRATEVSGSLSYKAGALLLTRRSLETTPSEGTLRSLRALKALRALRGDGSLGMYCDFF
jgi:hypothetical protein